MGCRVHARVGGGSTKGLLQPAESHRGHSSSSCRKFTTDIGYGKNNECLQRLRGGLGHCMAPKTVFTLPPPPPPNGTYFKIAVVLLSCKNCTFNKLVKLCTKTQSIAQEKEVWSDPCPSITAVQLKEISQVYSEDLYIKNFAGFHIQKWQKNLNSCTNLL